MKQFPSDRCFRCGFVSNPYDMILIVWLDGSEKPLCPTCFSLMLKEKKIVQVGHKYQFVSKAGGLIGDKGDFDEISKILGYPVTSEGYSRSMERHTMVKEARKLGMVPWITSRVEFLSIRAEKLCKKIINKRKQQALQDSLRNASEDIDSDGKPPGHNDPDLV